MPIALNSGISTILAGITGIGMSDTFSVSSAASYTFTIATSGPFSSLLFQLQTFHGYQGQTIATWNALTNSTFSFELEPGAVYRLNCSSFVGGSSATVTARTLSGNTSLPSKIASFILNGWTPIIAPIDCNYYFLIVNEDGSPLMRGSDPNDPTTQYEIPAGNSFALIVPPASGNTPRFKLGDTVTFLKSTGGTGPVVAEFYL